MAILCMAYFVAFGMALGAVGVLLERSLPAGMPRRWPWLAVIALSIALPILTAYQHASADLSFLGHHLASVPRVDDAPNAWYAGLDRAWLHCDSPTAVLFVRLSMGAAALLLAWAVVAEWRVTRLALPEGAGRADEREVDGARVLFTESVGPATVGFLRPRVLVPRWVLALPASQRCFVIRHEEEHRRAHDARLLALAALLVCLMPWNVALWWQLRRLRLAVEVDCDRRVVAAFGRSRQYGELLLRVAEAANRGPRLQPALVGRRGMLERRLRALLAPAPLPAAGRAVAVAAAVALLAVVLSVPHPQPPAGAAHQPGGARAPAHSMR